MESSYLLPGFLGFLLVVNVLFARGRQEVSFYRNYNVTWGNAHFSSLYDDAEVQLTLDQTSGAGFESKSYYRSGLFQMRIKIPEQKSPGVLTSFYLTSRKVLHDELDFEFIGSNGPPYSLSTNVYTKGVGGREQKIRLWFFVDKIPIRVFKNLGIKGTYPTQAMQVVGTIWNAEDWAGKIDWSKAPFTAHFQGFDINGCVVPDVLDPGSFRGCYYNHRNAWWSWRANQTLTRRQGMQYRNVRRKYLDYDYCSDRTRYPVPFPECQAPTGI
ncbi:xyloglucan endotransglucosylase/hydrolase protein 2-like [Rhodamnia argentea]|uniref:Xyloglucan endotransglucosylase/hydrolase n=1 Tax=Rhodamnia argentea TaxID=178133 RepID=A0ABM3HPV6_9MYRT|nr:xyloglucan endotransglucosylase/hydrolase protein 2-like [Rhodamnia argentea]